jgi:hypothetical protein
MFTILLDNQENDKTLSIKLPIVPRKGDWIRLDDDDEFTDGETLMTVDRVILDPTSYIIKVVVDNRSD